ncbi:MAG: four helix bundle protein [Acidobacteria bacterium]|nr:four helix bundle protein [Acidobacteriota bacterium]
MSTIRRFEDIKAWQKARELTREVYQACTRGQVSRDFGFKDQICRAAVSSMSNIAEGFARKSDKDFAHFLDISRGSAYEVQSLLYVALDVGYMNQEKFEKLYQLTDDTASLIGGFTSYLRR